MADVKRNIFISINGTEVKNSLSGLRGEMRKIEREIRNMDRNDKDYQKTLKEHHEKLRLLRDEYSKARGELSKTPGILQKIKTSLGETATGFIKAFTITAVIGAFLTGIRGAIDIIKEFDQAQANLAGILETSRVKIAKLTFEAMRLGSVTSFTSTQVSNAQLELAKLGKSVDEIINMTPGVLNAAIAMDSELAPAAELVAGQMNAFGAASSEAGKYADILSNSTNVSATSFESLATSLPKVSKVAAVAGVSFERLNAVMGVLADQNIAAETSGTGFRNILLTASKEGVHYEILLERVRNSTDQLSIATKLFGKENATVAVTLANSTEAIKRQTAALENSAGSADALAKERMNSWRGDIMLFDSAMEGFVLAMENGDGVLVQFARSITQVGTGLISLITPMRKVSDELFDEQMQVNELVSRITSSNLKNEDRLKLLKELKDNYPEFIGQIDLETASNDALILRLKQVNKDYRERIALQLEAEKADDIRESRNAKAQVVSKLESNLKEKLQKIINENEYDDIQVDVTNVEKSANEVLERLKKDGKKAGWFSDITVIEKAISQISVVNSSVEESNKQLEEQINNVNKLSEAFGKKTEAQKDSDLEEKAALEEIYQQALKLNGIEGRDFQKDDIESIRKYVVAKQAEIDAEELAAGKKAELSEKEIKALEQKKKAYNDAELAITQLIEQSVESRQLALLNGIDRDIAAVTLKYAKELKKYEDHADRLKEIENARDEEIAQIKLLKTQEYEKQIEALQQENLIRKRQNEIDFYAQKIVDDEERALYMLEKTKEINDMELQLQMDNELAKIENVENAEELKKAIKQKYATQKEKIEIQLADREAQINQQKLRKEKELENQKLDVIKSAFNSASELFNQGSAAWKATKIAETTIDTYQAGAKALAAYPPPFSYIAMGVSIATGLKNVQKIVSTKVPEMPTYYYGGHTGSPTNVGLGGDKYGTFTGLTHANEWVMPAFMTQSPRYADTLSWLENERKNGPSSNAPTGDNEALIQASILLANSAQQLNEVLANGVKANVNIGYKETMKIDALNKEINQSLVNSSIT